ncbi:uncharacterized protein LOC5516793 [Nematostella vectensis]|uniref:uncharacterized protein LOC5516793 n=1 Tax=Nematostella vectensis TaxID=45351 RepID=UPI0020773FE8|nr:uncharacterized protein LOC5516793 [Nematostella vectensis]
MEGGGKYWVIENSDDERDEELKAFKGNSTGDIPIQILKHYKQIEQDGVIEIKLEEYRKQRKDDLPVKQKRKEDEEDRNADGEIDEKKQNYANDRSVEASAFDYMDDSDEWQGPKRTPKHGRVNKKRVGSLQNVISDLKRFKELDQSVSEDQGSNSGKGKPTHLEKEPTEKNLTIQIKSECTD